VLFLSTLKLSLMACIDFNVFPFFVKSFSGQFFIKNIPSNFSPMSHNVLAVYDVLAARIRALRSKDQCRQNVGGVSRGSEAQRNDLGERNPEPPTGGEA
jgi:hypothetical protein